VIRVLLIQDPNGVGGRLGSLLAREENIALVGDLDFENTSAPSAASVWPDVVLINTDYMVGQILPFVRELKVAAPTCPVLILSDPSKRGMLPPRRRARGVSFLIKGAPIPVLADALRRMAAGEQLMDPRLAIAAIGEEKAVSTRELEVLGLAAQGESVADIARRLFLSLGTVRNHLSSVIMKTGARNRLDAIRIIRKDGWLR
jgi:two-component system response regulator DesR